mmetsp:Transcript_40665/g.79552  ORF Transcript_40665/g.79552 Transcript_40665/m.79552 type:complete len:86 (-) Transcript_40665:50-307(-)
MAMLGETTSEAGRVAIAALAANAVAAAAVAIIRIGPRRGDIRAEGRGWGGFMVRSSEDRRAIERSSVRAVKRSSGQAPSRWPVLW